MQSKVRTRFPIRDYMTSYLVPFRSYRSIFGHCVFEPPFGVLGTTYDVHLGLTGKRVVDFLLVLIELFFARCYGCRATSENRWEVGDFAPTLSL